MSEPTSVVVANINVSRTFGDNDEIQVHWEPEDLSLVEALGMLKLAEDTILRIRMHCEDND